jgi:RHH-type transcriptional regulator, rel operon repressor / antitoxin RelB
MEALMSASATLTVRIEPSLKDRLDQIAKSTNRSKSFLAEEAIRHFVDANAWQIEAIEEAVKRADQGGPFVSHTDVASWIDSWGTKNEKPRPKATKM